MKRIYIFAGNVREMIFPAFHKPERNRPESLEGLNGFLPRKKRFSDIFFCLLYIVYKNRGAFVGGSYTCQAGIFHLC